MCGRVLISIGRSFHSIGTQLDNVLHSRVCLDYVIQGLADLASRSMWYRWPAHQGAMQQ